MDISGVSATVTAASSGPSGDAVATSVQKKVMDIQEQTAAAMLEAIPDPYSPKGQNVDIKV